MQKREIPKNLVFSEKKEIPEGWAHGRILKLFKIKNKILLQLTENGQKRKACLEKGKTEYFTECRMFLQVGDIICGEGTEEQNRYQEKEFKFSSVYVLKASSLDRVESGLEKEGRYPLNKQKEYYHVYLAEDEKCAMYVRVKAQMILELRKILDEKGYMECFTPVLQKNFYGGGARPFITHMADNGSDMYLRVTSEIALRQYIAGGFEKVYEMGYYFRNGNTDAKHLTPFLAAEIYTAFAEESQNINLMKELFQRTAGSVWQLLESYGIHMPETFRKEIPICTFDEFFAKKTGISYLNGDETQIYRILGIEKADSHEELVKEVYKFLKQKLLKEQKDPLILTDLPAGISPLIQRKSGETLYRGYLIVNGATLMESAIGQENTESLKEELWKQAEKRSDGAEKNMEKYQPFLHASALGYPKTASLFVGVDRFVSALCGIENIGDYQMRM